MEQLKLSNGSIYDLVVDGIQEIGHDRLKVIILPGVKSFSDIESEFDNEDNVEKLKIVNVTGDTITVKSEFSTLDSITKQNDYIIGSEKYTDENEEISYRDITGTVYIIILSKPDLHKQVKNLQETVDVLVLDGLGV